jgi:hypothetical protein
MIAQKIFLSLFCITIMMHTHTMDQPKIFPLKITQISEFIQCIQLLQKQYPPSSQEYKEAVVELLLTKEYPRQTQLIRKKQG